MRSLLLVLILVLGIEALQVGSNKVVMLVGDSNASHLICLVNSGYSFFATEYQYTQIGNSTAWTTNTVSLSDIQKALCTSDVIIDPYLYIYQTDLITTVFRDIPVALYGMMWLNLGFGATTSSTPSCDYIMSLGYNVLAKGKQFGIITNSLQWTSIFGDVKGCPEAAKFMLWNWNASSTTMFGGWAKANRQQDPGTWQTCGSTFQTSTLVAQMEQ
jgi:hypothetical protein